MNKWFTVSSLPGRLHLPVRNSRPGLHRRYFYPSARDTGRTDPAVKCQLRGADGRNFHGRYFEDLPSFLAPSPISSIIISILSIFSIIDFRSDSLASRVSRRAACSASAV